MKKRNKSMNWIAGTGAVLILLTGALILIGPRLFNSEAAKAGILNLLSLKIGAQVYYAHAELSMFPQPHLVIHSADIVVPERVSAAIASVTVYPKIWPLLTGRIKIAHLIAQSPQITVHLPVPKGTAGAPLFSGRLAPSADVLTRLQAAVLPEMDGLFLELKDARLAWARGDGDIHETGPIQLAIKSSQGKIAIDLTGESSACKEITLKARLVPARLRAEGHMDLKGLRPDLLPDDLIPRGPLRIGSGKTGFTLAFEADLRQGIMAEFQGSALPFTLMRGDKTTAFTGARFMGTAYQRADSLVVSFSKLHLDDPSLDLSGEMGVFSETPRIRMKLEARELDVPSIRKAASTLAGTVSGMQTVLDIVRGGRIPQISIASQADSAAGLGDLDQLHITGRMSKGRIFIPETGMDLTEVNGDAIISQGVLTGTGLQARLGKAYGRDGNLKLGLSGDNPLFQLDMVIQADLTEALPLVQGLITSPSLKQEMGRIDFIQGSATARLILGETTERITARIEASEFDLKARYRPIPYLIMAKGGRLSYEADKLAADPMIVRIGRSSIARLSGILDWRGEPFLKIEAGKTSILLDEIPPWLAAVSSTETAFKDLKSLKGSMQLNSLAIKGPLLNPTKWRFNAEGGIKDLALISECLPGPLTLPKGTVKADAGTITFEGTGMVILDARLDVSGRVGWIEGIHRLEAVIDGPLGKEALQSISDAVRLPRYIRLRSPVTLSNAHIAWSRQGEASFKGDLAVAEGPRISLNAFRTPGLVKIEDLRIVDDASDARFRFSLGQKAIGIGFSGHLTQTCLDSLLVKNRFMTGSIRGDLWGRIIPGSPIESTIEGHLEGGDISLQQLGLPARIETFALKADQQRLHLTSDALALDNRKVHMDADVDMSEQGLLLRLNASADDIDLERTIAALKKAEQKFAHGGQSTRWSMPVKGTAHIKLKRLTCGRFEWTPFYCDISSEGDTVHIAVREASFCGVSTPGTVEVSPQKWIVHVLPNVQGADLASTIDCLTRESIKISGTFDAKGDITGEGTGEALIRSLDGPIRFVSKNGRIDRFGLLMNIFSLLNITEIFRGQLPDLNNQGFAYHSITVDGHLKDGKLHLEKALMDGSSMNIAATGHIDLLNQELDLAVFAAPFKTADRVLRMLPVIGYILDDTLVSIAVRVTGDVNNPKVDYLPASMLGSDLLGIMKRTLQAPIKVLTPMVPR